MYCICNKIIVYKALHCNHIDVNEPVLELVRILQKVSICFNKNFKATKQAHAHFIC